MADAAAEEMMNRLQKKCVIASAGVHLLLVVILFVGPAFLSRPDKLSDVQEIIIFPSQLVDGPSGGGSPHAAAPPVSVPTPTPPPVAQPKPAPPAEPVKEAEQVKETVKVKPSKPEVETVEPVKERTHKLSPDSLKVVTRKQDPRKTQKQKAPATNSQEEQIAAAQRRAGKIISEAAHNLGDGLSSATKLEDFGNGGGGPAFANYEAWVRTVYENAWIVPEDAKSEDAVTKISVTIGSDGHIIASRIAKASGDAQMDASIQRMLDRVTTIGQPFPKGAKEAQRTYVIPFNMKTKQGRA